MKRPWWLKTIDWIATVPTVIAFGLTLVVGDISARIARLFGHRPMENVVGVMQRALIWCFRISGAKLSVERDPGIDRGKGYIFLSNHQSFFDVPLFGGLLFSNYPKYVAKRELGKWIPLVSYNLRRGGNVLIDRTRGPEALKAIRDFAVICQERDVSPVIFPEGSRSRDGALKRFRPGGAQILLEAAPKMAVVPTAIDGSWRLLSNKMFPIPFGTRIKIRFDQPIVRSPDDSASEIVEKTRTRIAEMLSEFRSSSD